MLYTSFEFDSEYMKWGDMVGLCFYQESEVEEVEQAASCWAYQKTFTDWDEGDFYRIYPSQITNESRMDEFERVPEGLDAIMGTKGTWIMSAPIKTGETTFKVFATRFSPTEGNPQDPVFNLGRAQIWTYQSESLPKPEVEETETAAVEETTARLYARSSPYSWLGNKIALNNFIEAETVDLSCYNQSTCDQFSIPVLIPSAGATALTSVITASLTAAILTLAF